MSLRSLLSDCRRYRDQIDRLHLKYSQGHRLYELKQDGVSLASVSMNRNKFARLLAYAVGDGRHELRPARTRSVTVNQKQRLLYVFCITDLIVHGVVASIINERLEPLLSPGLYSYRKGTDWCKAVADFARYVRAHRRAHRDPKARGLYVLRRDVHHYTDSIPVGARSELWCVLRGLLSLDPRRGGLHARYWSLIEGVVRPLIHSEDGALFNNIRGVPTGSPISTTLFNLYLMPVDKELAGIPGAFYARYSDDILFAHEDFEVVRNVDRRLDAMLASLGLCANESQDRVLYFTGAGRASSSCTAARGAPAIPFLGCNVSFDATVSLNGKKVRQLLKDITARAWRTQRALNDGAPESAGPVVCAAINQALDSASPCRQKSAPLLRGAVTDRRQLKEIDYLIARIVARVLTGQPSVRAFRQVAYRTLRQEWKLVSLFHARNTASSRTRNAPCGP